MTYDKVLGRALTFALVALLAAPVPPAAAAPSYVAQGAGAFVGTVRYGGGGLPLLLGCSSSGFTMTATAQVAHVDAAIVAFAGPVTVRAVGAPYVCESFVLPSISWGWMTVSVTGTGPTGSTISCTGSDDYSREGTYVGWSTDVTNYGTCTVNGYTSQLFMGLSFDFAYDGTDPFVTAPASGQLNMSGRCPTRCQ